MGPNVLCNKEQIVKEFSQAWWQKRRGPDVG